MTDLETFRAEKDTFFAKHPQSPLTRQQKKDFQGLAYFPEAPGLRFEVEVERIQDRQEIQIQTSTGDLQTYRRYGKFRFRVDGQDAELTIYSATTVSSCPSSIAWRIRRLTRPGAIWSQSFSGTVNS